MASAFADDNEPNRISQDKQEGYRTYPLIAIPMQPGHIPQYYQMASVPNKDPALIQECKKSQLKIEMVDNREKLDVSQVPLIKKTFQTVQVGAGSTLGINSYLVSTSILDAQSRFQKGADAPTIGQIRAALDGGDTEAFLKILTKLSEERRSAATAAEAAASSKTLKDPGHDPCTHLLFGSGMFEVSGETLKSGDKDIRYFVRVDDVLGENAKLDLKTAKMQLLRGVSVFLFKDVDEHFQEGIGNAAQEKLRKILAQVFSDMNDQCSSGSCQLSDSAKVGTLAADTMIPIMQVEADAPLIGPVVSNRLILRKETCLLKKMLEQCGDSPALKKINAIVSFEKIDCDKPQSLLKQLIK